MVTSFSAVGQSVTRGEGPDKVTGKARYTADVLLPGMLWGKVLRSPFPHARIVSIDTSKARALPGVHAVITGQDIPDRRVGRRLRDFPVLARDRVVFVGEKVAAVAAETPDIAEEALLLIDVEYEDLPAVYDPFEAMQPDAPVLHPDLASYIGLPAPASTIAENNVFAHNVWSKGDIEQGFAEADLVFEHTFTTQMVHQVYIEPHACVAKVEEDGRVQMWINNKAPFTLRAQLAAVWDMPETNITLNVTSIGGDFGGKGDFMDGPLCYYLALHSGRPVKMVMDYIQEFLAGNPRHPTHITIKSGLKKDGTLVARQARVVFNSGASGAFKPGVFIRGADHVCGDYNIPHTRIDSYMVYTNTVPCGHMRSPGKPQVIYAVEAHTDMIARELGIDPYQFRLQNSLREGDSSPIGEDYEHIRATECLERAAEASNWNTPKAGPYVGRGMAISDLPQGTGESTAKVVLDADGKATLMMSLLDTGTGAHTIFRQMVAEVLTIPVSQVEYLTQNTDAVPFDSGSGGSRVTYTSGPAVVGAANELRDRLIARAAELHNCSPDDVQLRDGSVVVPSGPVPVQQVAAQAFAADEEPLTGESTFASKPPEITSFCVQVAEVEVDPETGQVDVKKITTIHDVGTVLNPMAHQGQIDGGTIMGLGYATMEEMLVEDGRVNTLSMGDYKVPTIRDIPELVTVLLEPTPGPAPFESKGIGESANIPTAGAIANAVHDAIGVPITDLPITAEKVLAALKEKGS
ncbi:MAG: xanthine dehydrogenase family protein molybdopterin-binding subunit [Dehalococcoidia bacterium]|nr:xanthine dehydrogenase family protein molybdopterin-binding subunit [Dehalococcoidia bacterium]